MAFAYPGDPCSTVGPECDLPRWLKGLKVLVGLKEGFDAQRIQNPECEQEEENILRDGDLLGPLSDASPNNFCVVEAYGTVEAESC